MRGILPKPRASAARRPPPAATSSTAAASRRDRTRQGRTRLVDAEHPAAGVQPDQVEREAHPARVHAAAARQQQRAWPGGGRPRRLSPSRRSRRQLVAMRISTTCEGRAGGRFTPSDLDLPADLALARGAQHQRRRRGVLHRDADRLVERELVRGLPARPRARNQLADLRVDVAGADGSARDRLGEVGLPAGAGASADLRDSTTSSASATVASSSSRPLRVEPDRGHVGAGAPATRAARRPRPRWCRRRRRRRPGEPGRGWSRPHRQLQLVAPARRRRRRALGVAAGQQHLVDGRTRTTARAWAGPGRPSRAWRAWRRRAREQANGQRRSGRGARRGDVRAVDQREGAPVLASKTAISA